MHTLNRHPDIKDATKSSTVLMGLWWVYMPNKWFALESELGRWIAHPYGELHIGMDLLS